MYYQKITESITRTVLQNILQVSFWHLSYSEFLLPFTKSITITVKKCVVFFLGVILFSTLKSAIGQATPTNFGPYALKCTTYETCRRPKQKHCGLIQIQNKQNLSDILFIMDFPKDCPVDMVRVTIGLKQNGNVTKKLWNYSLEEPCRHFVMGPILMESFNVSSLNCKVVKGNYEVHLNLLEKTAKFLGNNFFYGTYDLKVTAYNKLSNFFCVHAVVDVMRIPK